MNITDKQIVALAITGFMCLLFLLEGLYDDNRLKLKIGSRSVLYGANCFFIHPWFVAAAWWKLYGFPWDPRLWVAFFVHDIGYWGKPNMDGPEGETHPYLGAKIMGKIFGDEWFYFTLYHSRFLAKRNKARISKLCIADKYSFQLTPRWLYMPMVLATGEVYEYMQHAHEGKYTNAQLDTSTLNKWHAGVKEYMGRWIEEHKDLKEDTWTPESREAIDSTGVWK
jgi:hypothetical protein